MTFNYNTFNFSAARVVLFPTGLFALAFSQGKGLSLMDSLMLASLIQALVAAYTTKSFETIKFTSVSFLSYGLVMLAAQGTGLPLGMGGLFTTLANWIAYPSIALVYVASCIWMFFDTVKK